MEWMRVANATRNFKRLYASAIDTTSCGHNKHISNKLKCQHISVRLTKRRPPRIECRLQSSVNAKAFSHWLQLPGQRLFKHSSMVHGFREFLRPESNRNIKSDRTVNHWLATRILPFSQSHLVADSFFGNHTMIHRLFSSNRTTIPSNALEAFTWFCCFNCDLREEKNRIKLQCLRFCMKNKVLLIRRHCLFFLASKFTQQTSI